MRPGTWIAVSALTLATGVGGVVVAVDWINQSKTIVLTEEQLQELPRFLDSLESPSTFRRGLAPRVEFDLDSLPKPTWKPTPEPKVAPFPSPTLETSEPWEQAQDCTPGYDPCLPPAPDYDCRGGSGNGPAYTGRVYVTGPDIYDLDRDHDGVGCE